MPVGLTFRVVSLVRLGSPASALDHLDVPAGDAIVLIGLE